MEFTTSTAADMDEIFRLYDEAIAFQKTRFHKHWKAFDRDLVAREIAAGHQWKIVQDGKIACVFVTAFSDPFIWGEKNSDPAVYLHRIVTNPAFRGGSYVREIVKWAKEYGREQGLKFIRMDTWGDNQDLISYYVKCGFTFLGLVTPGDTAQLPAHYSAAQLSLFEISID
ncbi:GNAT family N-acetyltransferase [Chitinophaga sp. Mgbs1]|uniref:GNAT family N-acetyltransferase n=1 Tax=Chitinophaga solisilvae TaxID=1233460 RepID=A0A433WLW4_9BACT|nr:GNAT family N-acetyltransferase [Chitinophaga solisilvae]